MGEHNESYDEPDSEDLNGSDEERFWETLAADFLGEFADDGFQESEGDFDLDIDDGYGAYGVDVVSLEALEDELYSKARDRDADGVYDTAHTDGSTTNVQEAMDQGLVYDPPSDPPVLPSDDPQGLEIAAGFAQSMESTNADEYELPPRIDNQDLDLEQDIRVELRDNSETGHLDDVHVRVTDGVAWLYGTVVSDEDIAIAEYLVRDIEGVRDVENLLRLAGE